MSGAPESTKAFNELLAAMQDARDDYVLNQQRFTDELDVVEGIRYLTQMVSAASEYYIESDPEHPRMALIVSPARKTQGDNPDAIYHLCRLRGDRSYRIRGRRDKETYISFTIHGAAADGGFNGKVLADINDDALTFAADGTYELVLSADKHEGDWVQLHPDSHLIIVRSYFDLERSAQTDPDVSVNISIECLDDVGPPAPLADEVLASRIREGIAWFRQVTVGQGIPGTASPAPFVSTTPNTVGTPWSFRNANIDAAGAVDVFYSSGRWNLAPDEVLVMTGTMPECRFANLVLWNVHMQTLEYRHRRTSINKSQIEYEPDGSYRIVIGATDPGVPNWLDTEGHRTGTMFWRFLLPASDPVVPTCEVVPVASLR